MKKFLVFLALAAAAYAVYVVMSPEKTSDEEKPLHLIEKRFSALKQSHQQQLRLSTVGGMETASDASDTTTAAIRIKKELMRFRRTQDDLMVIEKCDRLLKKINRFILEIRCP